MSLKYAYHVTFLKKIWTSYFKCFQLLRWIEITDSIVHFKTGSTQLNTASWYFRPTHTHTHLPASHTHLPASCPWRGTSGSDSTGSGFAVACLSGTPCCLDTCRWGLYARSSWRSLCTPHSCTRRSAFLWKHNPKHQYTHAQTHTHIHESMHTKKASTRKDQIADYNCRWFHLQYCRVNWF